jgi:hypothetical protein
MDNSLQSNVDSTRILGNRVHVLQTQTSGI